jgi:Ni,Fe-hydrogenase maturation factor
VPIPTVGKTIAIIFGASAFPSYPALEPSPAFKESAENFEKYLTSYHGLRVPPDNVKWLFDKDLQPGQLLSEMRKFVNEKLKPPSDITDVIFYYCGHGGYLNDDEYFLALNSTDRESKEATVFKIRYLRDLVADLTKGKRNLIVLDACYSGASLGEFSHMSDDEDAANLVTSQISGISGSQDRMAAQSTVAMASEGIVLFCAAGAKKWAKTPLEASYTMFTGALLKVLEDGDQKAGPFFTLKKTAELVQGQINRTFGSQGVQPQIHVPVQGIHDILQSAYFPNPAFDITDFEARLSNFDNGMRQITAIVERLQTTLSTELDERIRRVIRTDIPVLARPTDTSPDPVGPRRWMIVYGPWIYTLYICVVLDGATFWGLRIAASAMRPDVPVPAGAEIIDVVHTYIICALAVHAVIATGSGIIGMIWSPESKWLRLFPASILYGLLFWNSIVVMIALGFLLLIPLHEVFDLVIPSWGREPAAVPRE